MLQDITLLNDFLFIILCNFDFHLHLLLARIPHYSTPQSTHHFSLLFHLFYHIYLVLKYHFFTAFFILLHSSWYVRPFHLDLYEQDLRRYLFFSALSLHSDCHRNISD